MIHRIDIDHGILRGRYPPSKLQRVFPHSPLFQPSSDQWEKLRQRIFHAIYPTLVYQQIVLGTLLGCLALPLLSFGILLGLIQTGYLTLQEKDLEDDDYAAQDATTSEEDAFELLLLTATGGCVGLGLFCLLLASGIRVTLLQSKVDRALVPIVKEMKDALLVKKKCEMESVRVNIVASHPNNILRRMFLAWCDVDYVLMVSFDENNDDDYGETESGTSYSHETPLIPELEDVYERL